MRTPKSIAVIVAGLLALHSTVAAAAPTLPAELCDIIGKAVKTSGDGFAALRGAPSLLIDGWKAKIRTSGDLTCMISRSDEPPSPDFWCRTPLSFGEVQLSLKGCFPDWTIEENPQAGSWVFALSNIKSHTAIVISADTKFPDRAVINVFLRDAPPGDATP
jgi:hypothetical protein